MLDNLCLYNQVNVWFIDCSCSVYVYECEEFYKMEKRRVVDNEGNRQKCKNCGNVMEFIEFIVCGDICPEWSCDECGAVIYLPETKCRRKK